MYVGLTVAEVNVKISLRKILNLCQLNHFNWLWISAELKTKVEDGSSRVFYSSSHTVTLHQVYSYPNICTGEVLLGYLGSCWVVMLLTWQTFWAAGLLAFPTSLYVEVRWGGLCYALFGAPLSSDASSAVLKLHAVLCQYISFFQQPVCHARMQSDKSWSCVLWSSSAQHLTFNQMILNTFCLSLGPCLHCEKVCLFAH